MGKASHLLTPQAFPCRKDKEVNQPGGFRTQGKTPFLLHALRPLTLLWYLLPPACLPDDCFPTIYSPGALIKTAVIV